MKGFNLMLFLPAFVLAYTSHISANDTKRQNDSNKKFVIHKLTNEISNKEHIIATLNSFIHKVAEHTCTSHYTNKQIFVLNKHVFGIHPGDGAIEDNTGFFITHNDTIIATGCWSQRQLKDSSQFLTPSQDPARMRTFFVKQEYQKYGLATLLLQLCENAAVDSGFKSSILYATLNGQNFYKKNGYTEEELLGYGLTAPPLDGENLMFRRMRKSNLKKHGLEANLEKLTKDRGATIDLSNITNYVNYRGQVGRCGPSL